MLSYLSEWVLNPDRESKIVAFTSHRSFTGEGAITARRGSRAPQRAMEREHGRENDGVRMRTWEKERTKKEEKKSEI